MDLKLTGARVLTPGQGLAEADVLIADGRIAAVTGPGAGGPAAEIVRLDGSRVRYSIGKRVELDAKGTKLGEDRFAHLVSLSFKLEARQLEASLSARRSLGQSNLTRTYRRVATPRAAAAVLEGAK